MSTRRRCWLLLMGAVLLAGCDGSPSSPGGRPNLLLVTIDTLRADALGCYGSDTGATPHLDALASTGVLFERAWTVTPLTTPAHATLMTGTYPGTHGVRNNGRFRLTGEAVTLAEVLEEEGYRTGAAVAAVPVQRAFGLGQGFGFFDEAFGTDLRGGRAAQRPANEVNAAAVPWLEDAAASGDPWFLWVHYYDPHDPYEAPPAFAEGHPGRPYDGEVAFTDAQLGELLAATERAGGDTVVVVVADHGESLGDHGESTHGMLLYEPVLRVPLLLSAPGRLPGGVSTRVGTSLADVMPTVLGVMGVPAPPGVQGADLSGEIGERESSEQRPLYAETFYPRDEFGWTPLRALRLGRSKLILGAETEWFDLDADPAERNDLAAGDPERAAALTGRLREVADGFEGGAAGAGAEISSESMEALEALGYLGGGGGGSSRDAWDLTGRDPREAIADYETFLRAGGLVRVDPAEAERLLARLVDGDPDNPQFLYKLGLARLRSGRAAQGEADLLALIEADPSFYLATLALSGHYQEAGRLDDALRLWERFEDSGSGYVNADLERARILVAMGRLQDAREILTRRIERVPGDARAQVVLADIAARDGDVAAAESLLREALATVPDDPEALGALARLLAGAGRFAEALPVLDRAAAVSPYSGEIRSRRAMVLARLGRLADAVEDGRAAVQLEPTSIPMRQNLGALQLEAGRLDEAEATFDEILRTAPDFVPALFSRGLARMRADDPEGAERDLRELLRHHPDHPGASRLLEEIGRQRR